jgi:hypothetical protein
MSSPEWPNAERRKYPRRTAAIQIELRYEGSTAPIRTETSDICASGCYVQMSITLAIGSQLSVALWLGEWKLTAKGIVITLHPQFGNGIEFIRMSQENREKLERYLQSTGE